MCHVLRDGFRHALEAWRRRGTDELLLGEVGMTACEFYYRVVMHVVMLYCCCWHCPPSLRVSSCVELSEDPVLKMEVMSSLFLAKALTSH